MKAFDIVGYTFNADIYCPACIFPAADPTVKVPPVTARQAEVNLDLLADCRDINRDDESSFDSGDFPKVVFASQVEGWEHCGQCGDPL